MKSKEELRVAVRRIDHKSYGMYKSLGGSWQFGTYLLHIDHVQGDPFASPSRLRFEVPQGRHGFPSEYYSEKTRRLTLEDQVLRRFHRQLGRMGRNAMGSGKSGRISSCPVGQTVQERIAVCFTKTGVELRFEVGFPARGRTILGREMEEILFDILPEIAERTLLYKNWDQREKSTLQAAIFLNDDQCYIRKMLKEKHLCAFVADGSILPRESGVSERPMKGAIPFESPESMAVTLTLPHKGVVRGMGIPEGITVIVGGGYHGKSTLLGALEQGVYPHILGDGREYVLTTDNAMKIRAEDGRSVRHADISLFIDHLPNKQNTKDFSSENASGSTSQAANLVEAVEAGAQVLLLDEDTSATNFMIRDEVMARLVTDDQEPITTLLRRIRGLYEREGLSFILVIGSSGDYLSVADHVLQMDHYQVKDVTREAKALCEQEGIAGRYPAGDLFQEPAFSFHRTLKPVRPGRRKLKTAGTDSVILDRETIDVRYLEQLTENAQTVGLAYLMEWLLDQVKSEVPVGVAVDRLYEQIRRGGLASVVPRGYACGQPVLPRKQELFACLNRYRSLKM